MTGGYGVVFVEFRALVVEAEGVAAEEDTAGEGIILPISIRGKKQAK